MKIITIEDLEKMAAESCAACGIDGETVFMEPQCHPGAGWVASHSKDSKGITLSCRKCRSPRIMVAVAKRE